VVKPHDEWNKTRIVVSGNRVEHWLNGRKVVAYELKSEEWKTKVTASKFNDLQGLWHGRAGLIGIQATTTALSRSGTRGSASCVRRPQRYF